MPHVTFINPDGTKFELDVTEGQSLMRAATENGVTGIVADCGGELSCASCHVVVGEAFMEMLPPASLAEEEMLNFTAMERKPGSRLSCQITATSALDSLVLEVADPQL